MPEISIKAEALFHLGSFVVTNSILLSWVVFVIIVGIAFYLRNRISLIPGKLQSVFEMLMEELLKLMDNLIGDRRKSEQYLPLVMTIFLFVLVSNRLGLFPGVGTIGLYEGGHKFVPIFRAPTADLNFTVVLAMIAMIAVNFFGIVALGWKRHASKFFNFQSPIMSFVGILELVSEFVKIISFSFRLFGNIFAGEVLLTIVGFLAPYFIPLPFLFLEVFVGFIQAFIFTMLTIVFIAMSVSHEEHAH
ncbi:MAG: F0F1 ATP synthase subunit A [bacterium]